MAKGERGTAKPYLRGRVWWIKYYVPGEKKPPPGVFEVDEQNHRGPVA
jgi:hypothetical protein